MRIAVSVLVLLLATPALASHEVVWMWDESAGATEYRILTAGIGEQFIPSYVTNDLTPPWWYDCDPGRVCVSFTAYPIEPGEVLFIVIVACNENGCSSTEHGDAPGDGYDPAGQP